MGYKKGTDEFIKEAKALRPGYNYSKVNYINNNTNIIVGCPIHGDFLLKPICFLQETDCPKCSEPKGEKVVRNWLEEHKITYTPQQRFKDLGRLSYDFYIPNSNLLIEYNGEQHYMYIPHFHHKSNCSFEIQLERDQRKKDYAEKNGYKLLVIPYTEFDNIESILEKTILSST